MHNYFYSIRVLREIFIGLENVADSNSSCRLLWRTGNKLQFRISGPALVFPSYISLDILRVWER